MAAESDLAPATYQELFNLDNDLESIDAVTAAFQNSLSQPFYNKRTVLAQRIPNFWPLVFEQADQEVDQYIQPSDSNVLTNYLTHFSVDRFESRSTPEALASLLKGSKDEIDEEQFGEPRSISIKFEFKENEYFEDKALEKKFWYRRSIEGEGEDAPTWAGRVSEPVKIHWKAGKDLSEGLTDAACALWDAQKKNALLDAKDHADAKAKGEEIKKLPEYTALMDKVDASTSSQSFFTWFSYHGPWISPAQDKLARAFLKEERKRVPKDAQANGGAKNDEDDEDDVEDLSEMPAHMAVEVFPDGEELADALAEDIWPNAIKLFLDAQDDDDDDDDVDMSQGSFDEADLEDLDEEALGKANLEEIKGLSGRGKKAESKEAPPAKKRKA